MKSIFKTSSTFTPEKKNENQEFETICKHVSEIKN